MINCVGCIKKCAYIDTDWWPPASFNFCRPQILFYLANAELIRDGKWPQQQDGSNYTDPAIRSNFVKIPSRNPEIISAEIDARLRCCGIEGKLLELEVQMERELSPTSWKALNYCSGWKRKTMSYKDWKSHSRKILVGR